MHFSHYDSFPVNMKILALILASTLNSVTSFPTPDGTEQEKFGHAGSISAPTPTYGGEDESSNCKIIRSIDYDEYEDKCETVQVYELCIPTRSQGRHFLNWGFGLKFKMILHFHSLHRLR